MELFKHQQEALEQTKDLNRVAYYLDMGLGKTFVGAEKMKVMNSPVNLIVCQKSKIQDWIDHFNEHYATDERSEFQKDLIFDLTNKKAFQAFISEAQQATEDHALDATMENQKYMYVMYDDFGKVTLKGLDNMRLNLLIDEETGQNFDYTSSIDENTYNRIKLVYDNEDSGQRDVYISQDSNNINNWGVLQYYDTLQKGENGQAKVDALLSLYNKKTRKLTIKNALGDTRVRAGSMVVVIMDLGDVKLKNLMLVEKCVHTFKLDEHTMELKLRGGEFVA